MLRGSRDFVSREEYEQLLQKILNQLNWSRKEKLQQELKVLRELPSALSLLN